MNELTTKEEVLLVIDHNWYPQPSLETVKVVSALGRVPARDYFSKNTLPVVRSALMDGYAVKAADFAGGHPDTVGWVEGREYARADMGDDFDDRFDAVVLVEDVEFIEGIFRIKEGLEVVKGLNIRPSGSQLAEGETLVQKHRLLLPKDLGFLQMGGYDQIEVIAKPKVVFIPTGNELISPGSKPGRGQNIDSNSLMAAETLKFYGAEVQNFPILKDEPGALGEALDKALDWADIVIMNGGSSKGGDDHNTKLLGKKAKLLLRGVAAAPGKPMGLYLAGVTLIVNLPGPMVAAYYGLEWCLNHAVRKFLRQPPMRRRTMEVTLAAPLDGPKGLSFLFNLSVELKGGEYLATPIDPRSARTWQGIGANAQYMTKVAGENLKVGDRIQVELVRDEQFPDLI
jgi:molybdopterin molybdotransferase/putative molybdopterin biosynthesis protein